jgi:hypothetical protein
MHTSIPICLLTNKSNNNNNYYYDGINIETQTMARPDVSPCLTLYLNDKRRDTHINERER